MKKVISAAIIAAMAALSAIMMSGCMNVNTVITFLANPSFRQKLNEEGKVLL